MGGAGGKNQKLALGGGAMAIFEDLVPIGTAGANLEKKLNAIPVGLHLLIAPNRTKARSELAAQKGVPRAKGCNACFARAHRC